MSNMPEKSGYTLQDIESYARASCPAVFAIINNISRFTFLKNQFVRQDGSTFPGHALHVGYLDRDAYGDCWYAVRDPLNGGIAMYHGLPGHKLTPAGEPFSSPAAVNNISDTIYPSSLAMNHPLSKAKDKGDRDVARQEKRVRLLLLVKFAHLLTGRSKHIDLVTPHGRDTLAEFVALCELMQREEDRVAKKEARKPTSTTEVKSGQASAQDAKLKQNTRQAGSIPKQDLKRKAATDDEPHTSASQGPPKKQCKAPIAVVGRNNVKPATKGSLRLGASFARIMGEPTTPRPMRSNPGPAVNSSNSNAPLAARSNNTPLARSSNNIRPSPRAGETLTGLRTTLASANKQFETAEKEASHAKQNARRWKKMYEEQQTKHETLQIKYEKLRAKYDKLKSEISNLKLPQVEDSDSD